MVECAAHDAAGAPATAHVGSPRASAGLLSRAATFFLPVGAQIDPAGVRGYPIDMRTKARSSNLPPESANRPIVNRIQFGLGCYEHWLEVDDERWLEGALACARQLISAQDDDGTWRHDHPLYHTFDLASGWASAMAQGQAASLLVRLHLTTGEEEFAARAELALEPLYRPVDADGLQTVLGGGPWLEEYPTQPSSYVLNGGIFALWGLRDVCVGLDNARAGEAFGAGCEALTSNLHRWDTGFWSLYALARQPIRNLASSFYHELHIAQLEAMNQIAPHPVLSETARRWRGYAANRLACSRAFAQKVAYRLLVPRNRLIARPLARFWARRA